MFNKYKDVFCGLFLIVIAAVTYIASLSITSYALSPIGAEFFPKMLAAMFAVLGIIIGVKGFTASKLHQAKEADEPFWKKEENRSMVYSIALIIAYIFAIKPVGFLIATFVYLLIQMIIMTPKEKLTRKNCVLFTALSLAFSVGLYFVFTKCFYLMLPGGFLHI